MSYYVTENSTNTSICFSFGCKLQDVSKFLIRFQSIIACKQQIVFEWTVYSSKDGVLKFRLVGGWAFHLSGHMSRHNVRIWGTHIVVEHERDSSKVWMCFMRFRIKTFMTLFFSRKHCVTQFISSHVEELAFPAVAAKSWWWWCWRFHFSARWCIPALALGSEGIF